MENSHIYVSDSDRQYIDGEKFINESEGRELATLNQNASKANDNW